MCGICGYYQYHDNRPVDQTILPSMLNTIRYRGPDDEGIYLNDTMAMGMCRLSIIDLANGQQPMYNEDRSVVLVYNGEIYNFQELKKALEKKGHIFKTTSDTEVIVHLYEEKSDHLVESLRGMFAFALWDARKQRLLIVRDRLGIKPLYFANQKGTLVFASEIKAILKHPAIYVKENEQALSYFLSLKFVPSPFTLFEGIYTLQPGSLMVCDANGVRQRQYWDISFSQKKVRRSEAEYAEELEALLKESVRMHLVSDVPFGAFLSGGVDSSIVVALMSSFMEKPVKTYSIGFSGESGGFVDERSYARLVSQRYHTDHHEVIFSPEDLISLATKVVWHLDQPIADQANLAFYKISETAAKEVKMVLTGEGGDELFAGYPRYVGERFHCLFGMMPGFAKRSMLKTANFLPGMRQLKLAMQALCVDDECERLVHWGPLFNQKLKQNLSTEEFWKKAGYFQAAEILRVNLLRSDARDALSRMLYVDTKFWLPDDLLARGDKMTMAVSLEARVPLLDHKLVQFAAALPPNMKVKGLMQKYLLKRIGQKWLPEQIIQRKKQGFPQPFALWFRNEVREFLWDTLSNETIKKRGLFKCSSVENLLQQHDSGFADHSALLWALLNIELWYKLYIDGEVVNETP